MPSLRKTGWVHGVHFDSSDGIARPGRLALIAGISLTVCVIALAAGAIWHEREEKLLRVQRDLTNLSHALAEHVARTLETIDRSLVASLGQLRDIDAPGAAELNQRALRAHADGLPFVREIAFYGADGSRRAASALDDRELPYSIDPREILLDLQAQEKARSMNVALKQHGAQGHRRLLVSRSVLGPQSELRGVIAASIDARRLEESYKAIDLGHSGIVALYSTRGTLLASHPRRDDLIGQTHHAAALADRPEQQDPFAGVHQFVSPFTHQLAMGSRIRIRGYPLVLTLAVDQSAVLAPWRRQALFVSAAAAMIAALIVAFIALLQRHLRRREESLVHLQENQAELSEAHRIARLGRFNVDGATGTIQWSAQAAQLLGAPSMLSSTFEQVLEHVHEEDRGLLQQAWTILLSGSSSDDLEFRVAVPAGDTRWLRARAEVLRERSADGVRARGTLIDISERKRVETAQRLADERLRAITSNIPGIVFEYRLWPDHTASFQYVSERALDVLEESPQALMHDPQLLFSMVEPAYRRRLLRSMRASRERLTLWTVELPIRTRTGRVKWMRGQSVPKPLADGSVTWDGVIIDVSAQKVAEQAIRTLNEHLERRVAERTAELSLAYRELESFSYSVSHDLRAPLRSIDGFSRILQEDYGDRLEPGAAELLGRVRAAASRMGQLIDDLLSLSRVTRSDLKRVRTDLSAMAQAIVSELSADSPQRAVEVRIEPGMFCFADPNLIRIALSNLLGNAWKFSSRRELARIEFGTTLTGAKTVYYVRDNGAGFDMKYAGKLFGAFQRVHSSREFDGTGIGLATVSRIVDRHGGAVWAQAEVNQGATFYFTLGGSEQR